MGNNAYKKEQADRHNKKRREAFVESVRVAQDKIDNPEKYKRKPKVRRKVQAFITSALAIGGAAGLSALASVEKPKLIKNWEDLAKVPCSDTHRLDIMPDDGNGWIRDETGDPIEYLSTHTFYSNNHEYSTRLLQTYGFNVILDNWDEPVTQE
jgi:hypothetical protein